MSPCRGSQKRPRGLLKQDRGSGGLERKFQRGRRGAGGESEAHAGTPRNPYVRGLMSPPGPAQPPPDLTDPYVLNEELQKVAGTLKDLKEKRQSLDGRMEDLLRLLASTEVTREIILSLQLGKFVRRCSSNRERIYTAGVEKIAGELVDRWKNQFGGADQKDAAHPQAPEPAAQDAGPVRAADSPSGQPASAAVHEEAAKGEQGDPSLEGPAADAAVPSGANGLALGTFPGDPGVPAGGPQNGGVCYNCGLPFQGAHTGDQVREKAVRVLARVLCEGSTIPTFMLARALEEALYKRYGQLRKMNGSVSRQYLQRLRDIATWLEEKKYPSLRSALQLGKVTAEEAVTFSDSRAEEVDLQLSGKPRRGAVSALPQALPAPSGDPPVDESGPTGGAAAANGDLRGSNAPPQGVPASGGAREPQGAAASTPPPPPPAPASPVGRPGLGPGAEPLGPPPPPPQDPPAAPREPPTGDPGAERPGGAVGTVATPAAGQGEGGGSGPSAPGAQGATPPTAPAGELGGTAPAGRSPPMAGQPSHGAPLPARPGNAHPTSDAGPPPDAPASANGPAANGVHLAENAAGHAWQDGAAVANGAGAHEPASAGAPGAQGPLAGCDPVAEAHPPKTPPEGHHAAPGGRPEGLGGPPGAYPEGRGTPAGPLQASGQSERDRAGPSADAPLARGPPAAGAPPRPGHPPGPSPPRHAPYEGGNAQSPPRQRPHLGHAGPTPPGQRGEGGAPGGGPGGPAGPPWDGADAGFGGSGTPAANPVENAETASGVAAPGGGMGRGNDVAAVVAAPPSPGCSDMEIDDPTGDVQVDFAG
eukprot:jgi/Botrbrau1/21851/Bobra.0190s0064.1